MWATNLEYAAYMLKTLSSDYNIHSFNQSITSFFFFFSKCIWHVLPKYKYKYLANVRSDVHASENDAGRYIWTET